MIFCNKRGRSFNIFVYIRCAAAYIELNYRGDNQMHRISMAGQDCPCQFTLKEIRQGIEEE